MNLKTYVVEVYENEYGHPLIGDNHHVEIISKLTEEDINFLLLVLYRADSYKDINKEDKYILEEKIRKIYRVKKWNAYT